jgi:hypothetical protein
MANQIQGNCLANNARLRLRQIYPTQQQGLETSQRVYSNATGIFTFTNIPAGTFQIVADLNEATGTYTAASYKFPSPVIVTMDAAGDNLVDVNLTPIALNAANPTTGSR